MALPSRMRAVTMAPADKSEGLRADHYSGKSIAARGHRIHGRESTDRRGRTVRGLIMKGGYGGGTGRLLVCGRRGRIFAAQRSVLSRFTAVVELILNVRHIGVQVETRAKLHACLVAFC